MSLSIGRNRDHRRPLSVSNLDQIERKAIRPVRDHLQAAVSVIEQVDVVTILQPSDKDLQNRKCHLAQANQRLIVMHAFLEIGLRDRVQTVLLKHVDQHAGLHAITAEERKLLERSAPAGVFTGQRLNDAGQLGIKQVEQRPRDQLGDSAAAVGLQLIADANRPLVETLDELHLRPLEQRPEQSIDETR